jgi:hypothetical protein
MTIELYEAVEFPYKWEHKLNLMENVSAVDTTLIYRDSKWWLFVGIAENQDVAAHNDSAYNTELCLFYSSDFATDKWKSHPMNPIVSDVRNARPAGALFEREGKLYRPAQDCAERYGHSVHINEVITLSESKYAEQAISSIRPEWDDKIDGVHTFAQCEGITIIDAVIKKPASIIAGTK